MKQKPTVDPNDFTLVRVRASGWAKQPDGSTYHWSGYREMTRAEARLKGLESRILKDGPLPWRFRVEPWYELIWEWARGKYHRTIAAIRSR